jgi:hypothetical protein
VKKNVVAKLSSAPVSFGLIWEESVSELREKLQNGEFVARPKSQLVEGGLGGIQTALDDLKKGVRGINYVVEV